MSYGCRKTVGSTLVGSVLLLFVLFSFTPAQTAPRGSVDWIFVLDTSASMHGAGGAANIFERVKGTIADFIRSTHDGDTVSLYTFDRDTVLRINTRIAGDIDKRELLKIIYGLSSNGDRTYTAKAIHDSMERATELKQREDAKERTVSIVLFTDGLEDVHGIPSPISIPSNISLIPKDQPYLFFVSLGTQEHEKQLEEFVKDPAMGNRGQVVRDPGASRIAEVADGIRKTIQRPPPPKEIKLKVEPSSLDFGQVEPGETTIRLALKTESDTSIRLSVQLDASDEISLVEPAAAGELKAGQAASVNVQLKSVATTTNGLRTLRLVLTPENPEPGFTFRPVYVTATLDIVRVPFWRKAIKYALILGLVLLLLAILVMAAISLIKGEPPWIWFPPKGATLEGEIEIIRPRPTRAEDEFMSLTQRQVKKVTLSLLVPGGVTDGDAELAVVRKDGRLCANLQRTSGVVAVNDIEVANAIIYNGDIIEFGNAKVRFHWIGNDRPVDVSEDDLL